jgi:hypothetical protein
MRSFEILFYVAAHGGPIDKRVVVSASSKMAATKIGREMAKRNDWRFMEVSEVCKE